MFKKSALKLFITISCLRILEIKLLYKTTAGIAAAKPIAQRVLTEVSNSLRSINESVDQVLLLGGGGGLFAQAAGSEFPKADVILGNDPVMSNAAGFLRLGRQAAAAKSQPQSASGSR